MDWLNAHAALVVIQRSISFMGVLIILSGIIVALGQYLYFGITKQLENAASNTNIIRLRLGRVILLGLEFIVAADLIGTTTAPDYYSVGILAIIVIIRTVLSYTLNQELLALSKEPVTSN